MRKNQLSSPRIDKVKSGFFDKTKQEIVNRLGLTFLRERNLDHSFHQVETDLPVYITLSTIPPRLSNTIKIVTHMLKHVSGIEQVILNIPLRYERFPKHRPKLEKHQNYIRKQGPSCSRLIINRCKDYGPLTKLLPSLQIIPTECILLVIDDTSYKLDAIRDLAQRQQSELNKVLSYCVYSYSAPPDGTRDRGPAIRVPQGADMVSMHGSHVRNFDQWFRRFLADSSLSEEAYAESPCFFVDDLLLGYYFQSQGIEVLQAELHRRDIFIPHCAVSPSKFNLNRQQGDRSRDIVMAGCYDRLISRSCIESVARRRDVNVTGGGVDSPIKNQ